MRERYKVFRRELLDSIRSNSADFEYEESELDFDTYAAIKFGLSLARDCAEIAKHFADDRLDATEYPPHGLVARDDRADDGRIGKTGDAIQAAILAKYTGKEQ